MKEAGDRQEEFLRRYTAVQDAVRGYVLGHVANACEAQDIAQEVAIALWKKFDRYDRTRSFLLWALGIARNEVFRARRVAARSPILFNQELADRMAERYEALELELNARRTALERCVEELPPEARKMLELRYVQGHSCGEVAARVGKKTNAVHVAMSRLRDSLEECAERKLAKNEVDS